MAWALDILSRCTQFLTVLGNRNYRTYWLGHLTSVAGHQMMIATQAWLVYRLTGSPLVLGLVGGAQAIPGIGLNLFAGALADRMNPRYITMLGQGGSAVLAGILAILVITGVVEVWHIAVIAFLTSVTTSFDQPSRRTIWPHLVDRSQFMYAISLNQSVWSSTSIIAPGIAAFIIAMAGNITGDEVVGAGVSYYFTFFGFLAMVIAMAMIKMPVIKRSTGATVFHDMVGGLMFTVRHRVFLVLLGMTFVNGFFGVSYMWLMPVFAEEYLGVDVTGYGLLMSVNGIGGVIGTLGIASYGQYQNRTWLFIGSATLFGAAVVLFAVGSSLFHWLPLALATVLVGGMFFSVNQVAASTVLNLLVPDEFRGRVMGLRGATWSVAPLGSLVAGILAVLVSTAFAVAMGGLMVILFALLAFGISTEIRNLRSAVGDSPEAVGAGGSC